MMRRRAAWLLSIGCMALVGCPDTNTMGNPDTGPSDAGGDGSVRDAGHDAGRDAGAHDGGVLPDVGAPDTGLLADVGVDGGTDGGSDAAITCTANAFLSCADADDAV